MRAAYIRICELRNKPQSQSEDKNKTTQILCITGTSVWGGVLKGNQISHKKLEAFEMCLCRQKIFVGNKDFSCLFIIFSLANKDLSYWARKLSIAKG